MNQELTSGETDSAKFVIIGAGVAGMATAYGLACRGEGEVLIVEKEELPGMHSSGRNAAMIRQVVSSRDILRLSREGSRFFNGSPEGWKGDVPFDRTGSLLVSRGEGWKSLQREAEQARSLGVESEFWDTSRIEEAVACTKGGSFEGGVFCPTDGVTDTDRLINGYFTVARSRGARLKTGCEVGKIDINRGKVRGVKTTLGYIRTGFENSRSCRSPAHQDEALAQASLLYRKA